MERMISEWGGKREFKKLCLCSKMSKLCLACQHVHKADNTHCCSERHLCILCIKYAYRESHPVEAVFGGRSTVVEADDLTGEVGAVEAAWIAPLHVKHGYYRLTEGLSEGDTCTALVGPIPAYHLKKPLFTF